MHLQRILLPDPQPLDSKFVSVASTYDAMSRLSEERFAHLCKKYSCEASQRIAYPSLAKIDPTAKMLLDYFVVESIDLFVGVPSSETCLRISPQVILHGAAGFDIPMSVRSGRFLIIEKSMPDSSLEAACSGYPMWIRASDIVALTPQGVSKADILRIGQPIIDEYIAAGDMPKLPDVRKQIMNRVKAKSGFEPTLTMVRAIFDGKFPEEWSISGRKKRRLKS